MTIIYLNVSLQWYSAWGGIQTRRWIISVVILCIVGQKTKQSYLAHLFESVPDKTRTKLPEKIVADTKAMFSHVSAGCWWGKRLKTEVQKSEPLEAIKCNSANIDQSICSLFVNALRADKPQSLMKGNPNPQLSSVRHSRPPYPHGFYAY